MLKFIHALYIKVVFTLAKKRISVSGNKRITHASHVKSVRGQYGVAVDVSDSKDVSEGRHIRVATPPKEVKKQVTLVDKENIYSFTKDSLVSEFKNNLKFREAILSGAYFFHLGKLCLYRPDAMISDGNTVKYSDDVEKNPGAYCLSKYRYVARRETVTITGRRAGVLYRACMKRTASELRRHNNATERVSSEIYISHAGSYSSKDFREGDTFSDAVLQSVEYVRGFIENGQGNGPDGTFAEFFSNCMEERKISTKKLADKTGIPERTITRMRTEEEYKPTLEYIIACCVAMKLLPWESDYLLYLAGYTLRLTSKKERGYITLIHVFFKEGSIATCDEILSIMELPTLSSVIDSNKKN